jgi:hypothetical protein
MSFSELCSAPEPLLPNAGDVATALTFADATFPTARATSFGLRASGTPDTQSRLERYAKHLAQE